MGQVASDASDFRGDLTQWLSMQGPLQARESPTLKATAGTTGAALASITGTHYGFTRQGALLHLLKHRGVDAPAPEVLRITEGNSSRNRKRTLHPYPMMDRGSGHRALGAARAQRSRFWEGKAQQR